MSKFLFYSSLLFSFFALQSFSYADYDDGDGSVEFPFEIAEPNQLIYMSEHPEDWDKHFILTADINLALAEPNTFTIALIAPDTDNTNYYTFDGTPFTGTFDGNGHIISNLTIDDSGAGNDYLGLFGGILEGEIHNLYLENVNVSDGDDSAYLGGLCGRNSYGTISNCYTTGSVTGDNYLGGLCGRNSGSISNSYSTGIVSGGYGSRELGGLCGYNNNGSISNCYATGLVSGGDNSYYLGGLCGRNSGSISNSYSTGLVSGGDNSYYLGGLCGRSSSGSCSNCYFLDTAGRDNGFGEPLDDPNMRMQNSFVSWDFVGETANGTSSTWIINPGENPSLFYFDPTFVPHDFDGQGTAQDPYLIEDPNDLGSIYQQPNCHYRLRNDLDLAGITWSVAVIPDFAGVFYGNGYTISNLNISGGSYLGLIGVSGNNAMILNLSLENVSIICGNYSRYLGGLCGRNGGDIINCYSSGSVTGGDGSEYLGGLCGCNDGEIRDCFDASIVTSGNESRFLGGLCGENYEFGIISKCYAFSTVTGGEFCVSGLCGRNRGNISSCYATGSVNSDDDSGSIGGLCGDNYYGTINQCYATVSVNGGAYSRDIGGLCGVNFNSSISNCYSSGSVTGGDNSGSLGDLCGYNKNSSISNCYSSGSVTGGDNSGGLGGLCGYNSNSSISNCYSSGSVTGGDNSGGLGSLCGYNSGGSISVCYFLDTAGPDNGYGEPLDDPNMRIEGSFVGWDFVGDTNGSEDHWQMCIDGYDYPRLAWQFVNPADFLMPGRVDSYDLFVFTYDWLSIDSRCCDINPPDGDGIVNFLDYVEFGKYWLHE